MKLLFGNGWLRRTIKTDPDDEPSAGGGTEAIDWKSAYIEAIRQRDALVADAARYRWLRGLQGENLDLAIDIARATVVRGERQ